MRAGVQVEPEGALRMAVRSPTVVTFSEGSMRERVAGLARIMQLPPPRLHRIVANCPALLGMRTDSIALKVRPAAPPAPGGAVPCPPSRGAAHLADGAHVLAAATAFLPPRSRSMVCRGTCVRWRHECSCRDSLAYAAPVMHTSDGIHIRDGCCDPLISDLQPPAATLGSCSAGPTPPRCRGQAHYAMRALRSR
jgi:hypothetical protein